jgi:hypothetical protein|tara:strand:- start:195 stop:548 length:354 start_codon:yes stop_codon:yes gene_type:complete
MRRLRPFVFENSIVPKIISIFAPVSVYAVAFGPFTWYRQKATPVIKNHESIHFFQQLELLFVFQWILYGLFWLIGLIKHRSTVLAYAENPFEKEAYLNQENLNYLDERKWFSWWRYL